MGLDAWLVHTGTLQRPTAVLDAFRNRKETYAPVATGVRLRLVATGQRIAVSEIAAGVVVTNWKALFAAGTDVRLWDRLVDVTFEDGTTDAGPFEILSILPRRGRHLAHQTAELLRVGVPHAQG